jgi:acid phosphatase type 7
MIARRLSLVVLLVVSTPGSTVGAPTPPLPKRSVVLLAAGDVQNGPWSARATFERTAQVIDQVAHDFVLGLGDLSNVRGTPSDYAQLHKAWGRHKPKMLVVPGTHDGRRPDGSCGGDAFYDYFNGAGRADGVPAPNAHAGARGKGYFARDLGPWLLIGLSFCAQRADRFVAGDAQMKWLAEVMRAKPAGKPVIVIEHAPRYTKSSGHKEDEARVSVAWEILLRHKPDVRVFLCGHMNGVYERWVPMDNARRADKDGIRSFTVGTGGQSPYVVGRPDALLEKTARAYGVLRLTLREHGYDWEFRSIAGRTFTDAGSTSF